MPDTGIRYGRGNSSMGTASDALRRRLTAVWVFGRPLVYVMLAGAAAGALVEILELIGESVRDR